MGEVERLQVVDGQDRPPGVHERDDSAGVVDHLWAQRSGAGRQPGLLRPHPAALVATVLICHDQVVALRQVGVCMRELLEDRQVDVEVASRSVPVQDVGHRQQRIGRRLLAAAHHARHQPQQVHQHPGHGVTAR